MTQSPRDPTLGFLTAPMILHGRGGWNTDVPDWMRGALPVARRAYLQAGSNPALACELDATIYLMTASLEQPLGSEWTRIYLYVAFRAMRELGRVEIPDDEPWMREAEQPLSRYEQDMLNHLRGQIRAAQVRHAKKAHISRRASTHAAPPPDDPVSPEAHND